MATLTRLLLLLCLLSAARCEDTNSGPPERDREPLELLEHLEPVEPGPAFAAPRQDAVPVGDVVGDGPGRPAMAPHAGRLYDTTIDCQRTREAPVPARASPNTPQYVLTESRLSQVRGYFLYCFFDQGGDDGNGDYQGDIHTSTPQIHKNLNFQLPFFGFRYNYTRVSMHGYLEFSDPPEHYTYPLVFPIKEWPRKNDPAFIGVFFSKARIGKVLPEDVDQRRPGVYFRLERDLQGRGDPLGVETRERLTWDLRAAMVGADTFVPKHAVIVTWKNMSFAGGIDNSLYKTNTFQLVLVTDEVFTYAIFNYVDLQWTSHTEAGGDTTSGEGGVPAYVGFNAGNGTQSYEYLPYSQASTLRELTSRGYANGFPGRHVFRVDEKILPGSCNKDIAGGNLPLTFAPESGNMLGGTVVNITGPCFKPDDKIRCRFDTQDVDGKYVSPSRAICVQPMLLVDGYVQLEVSVGNSKFNWKGKYFVETPGTATQMITFKTRDVHLKAPAEVEITWDPYNLTSSMNAGIRISLWGYRENTVHPELLYIDMLEDSASNTGRYTLSPPNYRNRRNAASADVQFGFLQVNLTNPRNHEGLDISPTLWSRPIPLAWYFGPQWERLWGPRWPQQLCDDWIRTDRYLKNFAADVPLCPCTLQQALADKGRFMADWDCDQDSNHDCFYHLAARHCVRTGSPSLQGSEQQCCYDKNNYLMLSYDQQWGSRPRRSHNLGLLPWNEADKVPTLSQWYHDIIPFYQCCLWQDEQAVGCETYRFERRPSQDCVAYQAPSVATVFGDPHVITFDELQYTFNGKGEFVLVHANSPKAKLDVQGRFEQVPANRYGPVMATHLTAIAARDNTSAVIEVRLRPMHAQWRYRLDVLADGNRVYFDRASLKVQRFSGVTVYTPPLILDQSQVVIMFQSGAGVEVVEKKGFMTVRVYLPWTFINQTRGLFGNWSFDMSDDLVLPSESVVQTSMGTSTFEGLHKDFAIHWMLEDHENANIGVSLFHREYQRTASYFGNRTYVPEWKRLPMDIIPNNRTSRDRDLQDGMSYCGDSYQCLFDYAVSLNRDMAEQTRAFHSQYVAIKAENKKQVLSCGVLETPRFGRKSTFLFVPGTKVSFACNKDFVLVGDMRRTCDDRGRWDVPQHGYTECLRQQEYSSRQAGFTAGIILAVLVPIVLLIVCIGYKAMNPGKGKGKGKGDGAAGNRARPIELTAADLKRFDEDEVLSLKGKETDVM